MEFVKITKKEYTEFASKHPLRTFFQTVEMEEISNLKKWYSEYFGVKKEGKIIAASRVISWTNKINKKYYYAQRGPLLDYDDEELLAFFTKNMKKYIKKHHGYIFRIDPTIVYKERDINGSVVEGGVNNEKIVNSLKKLGYKHQGFFKDFDYSKQVRWIFCLDIQDKTEDEIFKNMRQNHRNIIKKTEKFSIEIKELSYEELPIYKKITEDTCERKHFADKSIEYYQTMYNTFGKKNEAKFLVAYLNTARYLDNLNNELEVETKKHEKALEQNKQSGKTKELKVTIESLKKRKKEAQELLKEGALIPLSAALFILYKDEIYYLSSGSYKKYMNFYAQYAIQWHMIKYGIKNKFRIYNFYGITGNFDRKDPEYGIYEFKKGFNGRVVEYIGDFELPVTPYYYINKFIHKVR